MRQASTDFTLWPAKGSRPWRAFTVFALGTSACLAQPTASFQVIDATPPPYAGQFVQVLDVSNDGVVVGQFWSGQPDGFWGYTWSKQSGQRNLPAFDPQGRALAQQIAADSSRVAGGAQKDGLLVPVYWTDIDGPMKLLDFGPPFHEGFAAGVDVDGKHYCGILLEQPLPAWGTGFVLVSKQPLVLVGGLPGGNARSGMAAISRDDGRSFGAALSFQGQESVVWNGMSLISLGDLPGGPVDASFTDTSSSGLVAAGFGNQGKRHAVRWTEAHGMVDLGTHVGSGGFGQAWGMSGDGWTVVGQSAEPFVGEFAMIWNPIDGLRLLQDVLVDDHGLQLDGWKMFNCYAISDDGRFIAGIAGNPVVSSTSVGFLVELPPFCYADCDRGTGKGVLDVFDFLCYMSHFDQQDVYSNCNNDGAVDFFDFLCFINKWHEGCQ